MGRVAVFVDAGYLYKAGSRLLSGTTAERRDCRLNISVTLSKLSETACVRSGGADFLRVYWYDGLLRNKLSEEQSALARSDGFKLRFGVVNSFGQQKGIDSRIVMDLVELARNGAITDAMLLSGDEDVRVGVELAQSFGVRVHLLGIEPSRSNQADSLIQESDTTGEWNKGDVNEVLRLSAMDFPVEQGGIVSTERVSGMLDQVVDVAVGKLNQEALTDLAKLELGGYIPPRFDRP